MDAVPRPEWLTTREAAQLVGVTAGAVALAIREGRLAGSRRAALWYVDRQAVLAWHEPGRPRQILTSRPRPWDRIAQHLEEFESASPDELAQIEGISVANVRKHLRILANQGRAQRLSTGEWVLTENHQGAA